MCGQSPVHQLMASAPSIADQLLIPSLDHSQLTQSSQPWTHAKPNTSRVMFDPGDRQALNLNSPWPFAQAPNSPMKSALHVLLPTSLALPQIPNLALLCTICPTKKPPVF